MLKRAKTTGYHAWLAHALSRTRRKDCSKGLAEVIKGLGERELVLLRRARGRQYVASRTFFLLVEASCFSVCRI